MKRPVLKFKSKIDYSIAIVYILLIGACCLFWFVPYSGGNKLVMQIVGTCFIGIIAILFTWAVFSTYYLLGDDYVVCVSGPFRYRVFYSDITNVVVRKSIFSSLCLSFDKVAMERGSNFLRTAYASPKKQDKFIEELKKRLPSNVEEK